MKKGKKKFLRGKAVAAVLGVFGYMMIIASQGQGMNNGNLYSVDVTSEKEAEKTEEGTKYEGYPEDYASEDYYSEDYQKGYNEDYEYYYDKENGEGGEYGDFENYQEGDYTYEYDDKYFEEDYYESEEYQKEMEEQMKEMEEWEKEHNEYFAEDMKMEIESLEEELGMAKEVFDSLGKVKDAKVNQAVENLNALVTKADEILDQMKDLLDEDLEPEVFEEFWQKLDEMGMAAEEYMTVVMEYFDANKEEFEALDSDLQEWLNMDKEHDQKDDFKGQEERFKKAYSEVLDEKMLKKMTKFVDDDMMEEVMRKISAQLMEELAPHIGEDAVKEILNKIGVFGDKGETLLANTSNVYDQIAKIDFSKASENLKKLAEETKNTLIVSEMKDRLAAYWEKARYALAEGNEETMKEVEKVIAELLAKNAELSVNGEEAYQFEDVQLAEGEWYFEPVIAMKEEGIVSGYKDAEGEFTGEYKPSNNVTLAEVLKMTVEAAALQITPVADEKAHWAVQAGYFSTAQMLGLDQMIDLSNLNRSATREEVAVIVAVVFGLDTSSAYKNVFPDYNGSFGSYVQAVYDAGIFTGEGETGNFNGSSEINRAGMAKVINSALETYGNLNILSELDAFAQELEKLD